MSRRSARESVLVDQSKFELVRLISGFFKRLFPRIHPKQMLQFDNDLIIGVIGLTVLIERHQIKNGKLKAESYLANARELASVRNFLGALESLTHAFSWYVFSKNVDRISQTEQQIDRAFAF